MKKIIQFGENVKGYTIPVLNEREIRAAAGILFVLMFIAIQQAAQFQNFLLLKYAIVIFLTDMLIRVFINPRYAPTLIIGRFIVRKQVPEYVGAKQKKFDWIIGIILGLTSKAQWLIVFGFAIYIYLTVVLFHDFFKEQPYDLFGLTDTTPSEIAD